jgi:Protein of unknown function (DUF3168)
MLSDLVAFLAGTSAISSLISSRIYPDIPPQHATFPALSYNQVSRAGAYVLAGDIHKARSRIQIDSWAATRNESLQLADAVRSRMSGFFGSMSGTQVHFVTLDNQFFLFDEEAGVTGIYRVVQDYMISHLEA